MGLRNRASCSESSLSRQSEPSLNTPYPNNRQEQQEDYRGRTIVLVDTPNIFRSTQKVCGNDFLPDYSELLTIARGRGSLISAFALVNDGYPKHLWTTLERTGYTVLQSEGRDCDYRFVEQTVAVYRQADIFILCSGDHRFSTLGSLLRDLGKRVIVSGVRSCCSRRLVANADEFVPFPTRQKRTIRELKGRYGTRCHHDLQTSSIEAGLIVTKDAPLIKGGTL